MNRELDWARIAHLMRIGIAAALMVLVGDMLLGWGMHDAAKHGMEGFLSAYLKRYRKYFHDPEIREFDMQHEQWLFGGERYTAPVLKAIDEFMEIPASTLTEDED